MHTKILSRRARAVRPLATLLAALTVAVVSLDASATVEPVQANVHPPAGDGWQVLTPTVPAAAPATPAEAAPASSPVPQSKSEGKAEPVNAASPAAAASVPDASAPPTSQSFTITPQETNLRNALDQWLQKLGWQLAWRIDDDLPLEFNATFSGDFTSILTQVMLATNNMRTPARVCRHTNQVIRVIARAANCKE
ncbi:MAG: TcpQ domain-containing protein [Burkholderiales bacterium]|nr:TcpQ domain-containing protein [Burkholderiales bacterium]